MDRKKIIKIKANLCRKLVRVTTRHSGDSKSGRNQRGDHPLEPLRDLASPGPSFTLPPSIISSTPNLGIDMTDPNPLLVQAVKVMSLLVRVGIEPGVPALDSTQLNYPVHCVATVPVGD